MPENKKQILMPGQLVPVYDFAKFARTEIDVEITLVTLSVNGNGELIPLPGRPALSLAHYQAALRSRSIGAAEAPELSILQHGALFVLGGASCLARIRPHRLPLGFGVSTDIVSRKDPRAQFEENDISLASAYPLMTKLVHRAAIFLPLPRLYVKGGELTGFDVAKNESVSVRETMLPVCPRPLEDVDLLLLQERALEHLTRLHAEVVYLGYDLGSSVRPICARVTPEDVQAGRAPSPAMFSLPHGGIDDFYSSLRFEPDARVQALLKGYDRMDAALIPITTESHVISASEPEPFIPAEIGCPS